MSAPSDKRKEMTPEKLEKLRKMREKRAENALVKAKQKDEDAKQEILQERASKVQPEQEVVEDDVEQEPEEVVQKQVRPKKAPGYFNGSYGYGKTADLDVEYIRGIIQDVIDPPQNRKARKWQARKAEIKQELLEELCENDEDDDEPPVKPVYNNLASMFE